jgi:hypothetical protein
MYRTLLSRRATRDEKEGRVCNRQDEKLIENRIILTLYRATVTHRPLRCGREQCESLDELSPDKFPSSWDLYIDI